MLCRNRALERSLETWQEKQQRYGQPVGGHHGGKPYGPALSEEENHILISFLEATTALVRFALDLPCVFLTLTMSTIFFFF